MRRVGWIDAARYIAIFHVVFIHTLAAFWPEILYYWVTPPTSYIPFLINAKVPVLFFCVLLGFFASKPRKFKLSAFGKYVLKRYMQFAFFLLVSGIVYTLGAYCATWVFHTPDAAAYRVICDGFRYNAVYVLRDAFLFEANYNDTMWCMQQFFIASVLCYIIGCIMNENSPKICAIIIALIAALLLITGSEYLSWIAFCVMGALARIFAENIERFSFMKKTSTRIVLALLAWFLYKFPMPECTFVFFLMAVASLILLGVCFTSPRVHEFLSVRPLPSLGKIAFGVYVVHTPINSLLGSSIQALLATILPHSLTAILCFVITISVSTACAWLLDKLYGRFSALIFRERTFASSTV